MKLLKHRKFIKSYLHLSIKIQEKVDQKILLFLDNYMDETLRNHTLHGTWAGCRSIDITGDYRIIFRELSKGTYELVELLEVGTHSQLY